MLLIGRMFDRETGFVVFRKNGFDILIDYRGGDECGTRTCIATDMYSRYLPLFALPERIRALDLGANGGGFPLMLRIHGIQVNRVVSVEMNPLTFVRLHVNLATNLGTSAVAINAAVCGSDRGSEILMKPSRGSTSNSIFADQADATEAHIGVPTTTIKDLYTKFFDNELVDICKIDIEGAEYEACDESADEALKKIRYLLIEFHDRSKTPAFIEHITALGFREMAPEMERKTGENTEVRAYRGPEA
ncbi:MAG: FkbM family methyltransferase [Terracidiphilus sp.]